MDGGSDNFTVPPLTDFLHPKIGPPLQPYPAYVNLSEAHLDREPNGNVVIRVPPAIFDPLGAGVGRKLQAQGIKVVLSIFSHWQDKEQTKGVGWSTLTAADNKRLVEQIRQLKKDEKNINGIDGIDIDDEFGPVGEPENFYNTVHAIRSEFPDLVISSPIYEPDKETYKKYFRPPDKNDPAKNDLAELMTYCATMNYGDDKDVITNLVLEFHGLGIPKEKLYAGVYPGPIFPDAKSCRHKPPIKDCDGKICKEAETNPPQAWTSIEKSKEVAEWAKKSADGKPNCAGVMIYTYSTDTVEYASCPIKSGWPNKDDHAWQKAITSVLTAK
jgi:hypothetical protein